MMRWVRTLWANRPTTAAQERWMQQLDMLHRNEMAEGFAYRLLMQCVGLAGCDDQAASILDIRTERVAILRRLGWHREADELAADTDMRRGWLDPAVRRERSS